VVVYFRSVRVAVKHITRSKAIKQMWSSKYWYYECVCILS